MVVQGGTGAERMGRASASHLGDEGRESQPPSGSLCMLTAVWPALIQAPCVAGFILRYYFRVACASLQRPWGVSPILIFKNSSSKGTAFLEEDAYRTMCFQLSLV